MYPKFAPGWTVQSSHSNKLYRYLPFPKISSSFSINGSIQSALSRAHLIKFWTCFLFSVSTISWFFNSTRSTNLRILSALSESVAYRSKYSTSSCSCFFSFRYHAPSAFLFLPPLFFGFTLLAISLDYLNRFNYPNNYFTNLIFKRSSVTIPPMFSFGMIFIDLKCKPFRY